MSVAYLKSFEALWIFPPLKSKKPSGDDNHLSVPPTTVTPQHVLTALKAYTPVSAAPTAFAAAPSTSQSNSETVTKIRNLGLQARPALNILLAAKRLEAGLSEKTIHLSHQAHIITSHCHQLQPWYPSLILQRCPLTLRARFTQLIR